MTACRWLIGSGRHFSLKALRSSGAGRRNWTVAIWLAIMIWLSAGPRLQVTVQAAMPQAENPVKRSAYPYPVRMRIELLSIRNRSCSPVPVQIKLEYNDTRILEGHLQLKLYDALDVVGTEGLLATLRIPDIVLSGGDQVFNAVLPPLQTSNVQNLAVQAWFETESQRIPLSSSLKEVDPPRPHDLLMPSPFERVSLLCSCTGNAVFGSASANKIFLERQLSLENYNPLQQVSQADEVNESEGLAQVRRSMESMGRHIQYFSTTWPSRDLPSDPLSYCCFDIVVLNDGALAKLTSGQMQAMTVWLRAGGSVCIVPDGSLRSIHLNFLQDLFSDDLTDAPPMLLDDAGGLIDETLAAGGVRFAKVDLGRAVLLPAVDDLAEVLDRQELAKVVAWLWKVRRASNIWNGQAWNTISLVDSLRRMGLNVQQDNNGYYFSDSQNYSPGGQRYYMAEEQLRQIYGIDDRLAPVRLSLIDTAAELLLPNDVEMVPTWVIAAILIAYVVTIGPVDYLLLGWLKLRKATWIAFPLVTALFTTLTIGVAHHYMGSAGTGGWMEFVDVGDAGTALRKSRVDMLFYGSTTKRTSSYANQFSTGMAEFVPPSTYASVNEVEETTVAHNASPLQYDGRFPSSYEMTQTIQQWSPQLNRVFELAPQTVDIPAIDWTDPSLVVTEEGRTLLAEAIRQLPREADQKWCAVVVHLGGTLDVFDSHLLREIYQPNLDPRRRFLRSFDMAATSMFPAILAATNHQNSVDFFQLVSRVSPQGSGFMEDMYIADSTDPAEWVLILIRYRENEYEVFRKLYQVE